MGTALTARDVGLGLSAVLLAVLCVGLGAGAERWSFDWANEAALITAIRAPRGVGAVLAGAALGLAGAIAQGLFRNPLADPYLLGSAAGAALGVTVAVAIGAFAGSGSVWLAADLLLRGGVVLAAFIGALAGVGLTLVLAGGTARPTVLLLAGVVVGVIAAALADLLTLLVPEALRGRQAFLLGSTAFIGWQSAALMGLALAVCLPAAMACGRGLDALVLGESAAASLGLRLPQLRAGLVAVMALATGAAVAQVGLVGFVGLAAPHLVRRLVTVTHAPLLGLSALAGGVLLGAADLAARVLLAPAELPVGLLTAVLGGAYLLWLLRRQRG